MRTPINSVSSHKIHVTPYARKIILGRETSILRPTIDPGHVISRLYASFIRRFIRTLSVPGRNRYKVERSGERAPRYLEHGYRSALDKLDIQFPAFLGSPRFRDPNPVHSSLLLILSVVFIDLARMIATAEPLRYIS